MGRGLGALPGAGLGAGTQQTEICLFWSVCSVVALFSFFFLFLEVASEHFKRSKNKTEGENKPLWNVAES